MIIQIYEIQTPEEARLMVELGVDHVGSVLVSQENWKNPAIKSVIHLVQEAGCKSSVIPLFQSVEYIAMALDYYAPDIVHLCETLPWRDGRQETLDAVAARQISIREKFPEIGIMRSIPIGIQGAGAVAPSLELARLFEPISDWFLTDTLVGDAAAASDKAQPVNGYIGITGKTCDWDVAQRLVAQSTIPVILAGGIGPENVGAGIVKVRPAGVDSCTRTNRVDNKGNPVRFQKDPRKVGKMVREARKAAKTCPFPSQ